MALSEAEELELIALLELEVAEIERKQPIWQPNRDKENPSRKTPQQMLMECTADIIFFGGGAGGGKTDGIVGFSLLNHDNVLVLRRTYPEFEQIKKRYTDLVGPQNMTDDNTLIRWKGEKHPSIKARRIKLGHLQNPEKDWHKYQGNEFSLIAVDEGTEFPFHILRILTTWLRSPISGQLCQMLITFNPPTHASALWILDILAPWIDPAFVDHNGNYLAAESGQVLHVALIEDQEYFFREPTTITTHPKTGKALGRSYRTVSRTFIRALVSDNPYYAGTDYERRLESLTDVQYRAMRLGEMTASLVDEAGQIIKRKPFEAAVNRWKAIEAAGEQPKTPPLVVSIDIASGGDDHFVCMPFWKGGYAGMPIGIEGKNVPNVQAQVKHVERYMFDVLHTTPDLTAIIYDATGGWGSGFAEIWRQKYPNASIIPFNGGEKAGINQIFNGIGKDASLGEISGMPLASGPIGFDHRIGAAWYRAGEMLEHELFSLAVPPHNRLAREAQSRLVEERNHAKITIESKEKLSKKLGHSPDYADAWVIGLWYLSVVLRVRERSAARK